MTAILIQNNDDDVNRLNSKNTWTDFIILQKGTVENTKETAVFEKVLHSNTKYFFYRLRVQKSKVKEDQKRF
jgi:hypothetical protein